MWYVIQVINGREDVMRERIERVVPASAMQELFYPQFQTEIKVRGEWVNTTKPLFPGYLICDTADPRTVQQHLLRMDDFARVLSQDGQFVPLAKEEVQLIGGFTHKGDRVVPMSEALKDGDQVVVTAGPLLGHEALLKTREGRAWLSRYPKVSSLSKTLLCGKFLGYGDVVPAMTRLFLDEAGKLYAETWLVVQEIGLAFDLDSRKPGEEYGLVVEMQRHPLVADDDALARVAVQHGYTVLGARLDLCNEDLLGVDDAAAVFDVLDALGILAEGRVPTLEDIMKSYLESCVDVPAGGWGTFAER